MKTTPEAKKAQLIAGLTEARAEFIAALSTLAPEDRDTVFLGVWSAHDIVAHLIGWDYADLEAIDALFGRLAGDALGLRLSEEPAAGPAGKPEILDGAVRLLIEMRREARAARDWARADSIRNRLAELGIALEDGPDGTRWRLIR